MPAEQVAASRALTGYLGADHRQLDARFDELCRLALAGNFATAGSLFQGFRDHLQLHIEAEERLLFPAFEKIAGSMPGPTRVMRAEHLDLGRFMAEVSDALASGNAEAFERQARRLRSCLAQHNAKEEGVLYPLTDRLLADCDRGALLARLQQLLGESSAGRP